jgi:hypothetical protein
MNHLNILWCCKSRIDLKGLTLSDSIWVKFLCLEDAGVICNEISLPKHFFTRFQKKKNRKYDFNPASANILNFKFLVPNVFVKAHAGVQCDGLHASRSAVQAAVWYSWRLLSPPFVCILVYHILWTRSSRKWHSIFRIPFHLVYLLLIKLFVTYMLRPGTLLLTSKYLGA